jgi:hypothetical protein
MKLRCSAGAVLVLTMVGASAHAQAGMTREQVLSELAEARRLGDVPASGCGGGTLREQFPHRNPAASVVALPRRSAAEAPRVAAIVGGDRASAELHARP